MELSKQELLNIEGGGAGIWAAIAAGVIFVVGIIDGYIRPYKCR